MPQLVVPLVIDLEETMIKGFVGPPHQIFVSKEQDARKFSTAGDAALYVADHAIALGWMHVGRVQAVKEDE